MKIWYISENFIFFSSCCQETAWVTALFSSLVCDFCLQTMSFMFPPWHVIWLPRRTGLSTTTTNPTVRKIAITVFSNCRSTRGDTPSCWHRILSLVYRRTSCEQTGDNLGKIPKKDIQYKYNVSVNNTTLYFIYNKKVYCQGDMFRPLLGHLQALWENRSKRYLYPNALWDPKCLQYVLY